MTLHELMTADDETFLRVCVELGWYGQLIIAGDAYVTDEYWGFMASLKAEYDRRWPNGNGALEATLSIVERFVR